MSVHCNPGQFPSSKHSAQMMNQGNSPGKRAPTMTRVHCNRKFAWPAFEAEADKLSQDACPPTNDHNCCEQPPTCVSDLKIGSQLTHAANPTHNTSTLVTQTGAKQITHSIATYSLIFCLPVQRLGMSMYVDMCGYRTLLLITQMLFQ